MDFIVTSQAMSAGTVLVMSGDNIYMNYYSLLGPIDPQVRRNGQVVPALGYLEQYSRLIAKSREGTLTTAELAFLVQKFDPAELYLYEQAREHSVTLLKKWLVEYKFKNWTKTRSRQVPVTQEMKEARAVEIAESLNDTQRWHSHGRGITIDVLRNDVKLEIEDFDQNPDLRDRIRDYYKLLVDYRTKRGHDAVVHSREGYIPLST